jgi:hypothetical protein
MEWTILGSKDVTLGLISALFYRSLAFSVSVVASALRSAVLRLHLCSARHLLVSDQPTDFFWKMRLFTMTEVYASKLPPAKEASCSQYEARDDDGD